MAAACLVACVLLVVVGNIPHLRESAMTAILVFLPVAWAIYRKAKGQFDWFELGIIFGVLHLLYFGVGALWLTSHPEDLYAWSLRPYITPALLLGTVAALVAFAGYAFSPRVAPSPLGRYVPVGTTLYVVILLVGFVGQLATVVQERTLVRSGGVSALASAVQQFGQLFVVAWTLLWFQFWSGKLTRAQRALLFGVAVPMVGVILVGLIGGKEQVLETVGFPAVCYWYARRRLPWRTLASIALVGIFVVFPFYNTIRTVDPRMGVERRVERTFERATRWDREAFLDRSVRAVMHRFSLVYCVGAILRDVPSVVPYRWGDTIFLTPISIFIPRILWPEKPTIFIGREFGETFQLVSSADELTKVSPTLTGEFYWNFGLAGVVVGMFLFGIGMRAFYERFGAGRDAAPLRRACYLGMLPIAIHSEGNLAPMVGAIVKTLIVLTVLFWVARRLGWIAEEAGEEGLPGAWESSG